MQKLTFHPLEKLSPLWDDLEEKKTLEKLLTKKHAVFLQDEYFEITAGFNKEQVQLKVELKKFDDSFVYPLEIICMYHDYPRLKKNDIAALIVDYVDLYWCEYFKEERELFLPIDFSTYEYEGLSFFLRGFIRKLSLEREADAFLERHGHGEHEIFPISSET